MNAYYWGVVGCKVMSQRRHTREVKKNSGFRCTIIIKGKCLGPYTGATHYLANSKLQTKKAQSNG